MESGIHIARRSTLSLHSIEQFLTLSAVSTGLKLTRNKLRSFSFAYRFCYSYVATKLSHTVRYLSNGRIHDYIRNGLESELVNPDGGVDVVPFPNVF